MTDAPQTDAPQTDAPQTDAPQTDAPQTDAAHDGLSVYALLRTLLTRPALYSRTPDRFWNDPHISRMMLEAHLDPGTDAASRKPEFVARSVAWILSLLPKGARLLDLGCGPGLYTLRFAQAGMQVTGVDFSERSIAYARTHDPDSDYRVQNYLEMEDVEAYDASTLIWCDYGALTLSERQELVKRVHRALKPGGLFLLDVFTHAHCRKHGEDTAWEVHPAGGFWSPRPHITLWAAFRYGESITLNRTVVFDEQGARPYNIWNTCFGPDALLSELALAGFTSVGVWGDVAGSPWTEESDTLCAVLKKL